MDPIIGGLVALAFMGLWIWGFSVLAGYPLREVFRRSRVDPVGWPAPPQPPTAVIEVRYYQDSTRLKATARFVRDAVVLANLGYYPIRQDWTVGEPVIPNQRTQAAMIWPYLPRWLAPLRFFHVLTVTYERTESRGAT